MTTTRGVGGSTYVYCEGILKSGSRAFEGKPTKSGSCANFQITFVISYISYETHPHTQFRALRTELLTLSKETLIHHLSFIIILFISYAFFHFTFWRTVMPVKVKTNGECCTKLKIPLSLQVPNYLRGYSNMTGRMAVRQRESEVLYPIQYLIGIRFSLQSEQYCETPFPLFVPRI